MSLSNFNTPSPIAVALDLYVADVQIVASDRTDTIVEVRPSDPGKAADVKAAENTRVEYDDATRTLSVITRKPRNRFVNFSKRPESIDVVIQLPADSDVRGEAGLGDYRTEGVLGAVALKTDMGAVRIGETGTLNIRTGLGEITVNGTSGSAEVHSGSGEIRIGAVTGPANVKVSNGALSVDRALSDITASSSNGEVRIGEVVRGKVSATSKNGRVDVGVREGSAAWLELNTAVGRVYNELASSGRDDDGLTLQLTGDGRVSTLRTLLKRLDDVARRLRREAAADVRRHVAVHRAGAVGQERGDREQLADVPDPPAVPRQRAADRYEDRRQPGHHDRLVRRDRDAVVRVVAAAVRAGAEAALTAKLEPAGEKHHHDGEDDESRGEPGDFTDAGTPENNAA
jgi:hypothetical protein